MEKMKYLESDSEAFSFFKDSEAEIAHKKLNMYRCKSSAKNGTADGTSDTVSTTITVLEYPHSNDETLSSSPTNPDMSHTIMVNPER